MSDNKGLTIYNPNQVVRVDVSDKKKCTSLKYRKEKKGWFRTKKEGFYYDNGLEELCYPEAFFESNTFKGYSILIMDKQAYYYPSVQVTFTNNNSHYREFLTYAEALNFADDITRKVTDPQNRIVVENK